jgi:hypothetical protein
MSFFENLGGGVERLGSGFENLANAGDRFTQSKYSQPERGGLQHAVLQDEQNVYDNGPMATKLLVALGLLWGAGAAGTSALGGGAAGGAGSAGAFDASGMGTGVDAGVMSSDAGLSSTSTQTPYWQRLLRNQGISRGIGLLSSNGGGQGNNTVSTPSSGFYGSQPTTQPQPMQQQPTLVSQNQASNQQLGMGGLLRRNQSGYGRPYG